MLLLLGFLHTVLFISVLIFVYIYIYMCACAYIYTYTLINKISDSRSISDQFQSENKAEYRVV